MEYTEGQKTEIRARFAARRRRQLMLTAPVIAVIMGMTFLEKGGRGEMFGIPVRLVLPAFLVFVTGVIVFSLLNWRCPACNGYLGKRMSPKFCSRCGVTLQ